LELLHNLFIHLMHQTQDQEFLLEHLLVVVVEDRIHKELVVPADHLEDQEAAEMHLIHLELLEMVQITLVVAEEQDVTLTHLKVETILHLVVMEVLDMF
jgi:hypothetical protein